MNKATITIAIFIIFIIFIIGGLLFLRAGELRAPEGQNNGFAPMISEEELALHNTVNDCWIAYDTTVYDVSDWLKYEPDGGHTLLPFCGTAKFTGKTFLTDVGDFVGTLGVIEGVQS